MNTTHKKLVAAACLVLLTPCSALADGAHHEPTATATVAASEGEMTDGEVRKIDLEAGKLTLKHAEIKNLDMPPMTMVFAVRDKAMLDKLKPGDKVRFRAVDDGGRLTLSEIRLAP